MKPRRAPVARIEFQPPVEAVAGASPVRLIDLGVDGLTVEHSAMLWAGRRVRVAIPRGAHLVSADCLVVRSRAVPNGQSGVSYRSGLVFVDLDRETRSRLHALIEELLQPVLRRALAATGVDTASDVA